MGDVARPILCGGTRLATWTLGTLGLGTLGDGLYKAEERLQKVRARLIGETMFAVPVRQIPAPPRNQELYK